MSLMYFGASLFISEYVIVNFSVYRILLRLRLLIMQLQNRSGIYTGKEVIQATGLTCVIKQEH